MKRFMLMSGAVLGMVLIGCMALPSAPAVQIIAPADGTLVGQLHNAQREFLETPFAERGKYFDGGEWAKKMRADLAKPRKIRCEWKGDGVQHVTLRRLSDGKVFYEADVATNKIWLDSLEVAREWQLTVGTAQIKFRTEDGMPRLMNWIKVPNVRDIGGRRGLNGRRIKQGLVYRAAGLNNNATTSKKDEKGKSVKLPPEEWKPGKERLTDEMRTTILQRYGIVSDIDLRSDAECFGMKGSPLNMGGATNTAGTVKWWHYSYTGYSSALKTIAGTNCNQKVFRVFMDAKNYPLVFHCIGGADRTGTVAYLLEALLGVEEDELFRDYLTTGFCAGVSDRKHEGWFTGLHKTLQAMPGATLADKAEGWFIALGFTKQEVEWLREFLLEPKEGK